MRTVDASSAVKDQSWSSCEHPVFSFFRQGGLRAGGGAAYIDKDKIENSGSQTSGQGKGDSRQVRQRHRQLLRRI
jgi:hypothetical protein